MKKMIVHHSLPPNPNATSVIGIRLLKMIKAFKKSGYEVNEIIDYGKERAKRINFYLFPLDVTNMRTLKI